MTRNVPADIKALGFEYASGEIRPNLLMSIFAKEKCGKTHFSLTAPQPIAYFSIDVGEEGVVHKFINSGKIVYRREFEVPKDQDKATRAWEEFKKSYRGMLKTKNVRSIIIDTATEVWELARISFLGKVSDIKSRWYGPVNADYATLLNEGLRSDKNVILLHKDVDEYVNDKATGKVKRAGFKGTGGKAQIELQLYRENPNKHRNYIVWGAEVMSCRHKPELMGTHYENDECTFPMIAWDVMPDIDPANWMD